MTNLPTATSDFQSPRASRTRARRLLHGALSSVTRRYPLNSPRARLLRLLPDVPSGTRPFVGKHGLVFGDYYSRPDPISKSLYWFGDFDPWVNRTLTRLARPGETTLDIGANIGATALILGLAVGLEGQVVCFEPLPENIAKLGRNIASNNLDNVAVVGAALSDADGSVQLYVDEDEPGTASVARAAQRTALCVPARRFDEWASEQSLGPVGVCKIDVEGHEPAVLRGMSDTLERALIASFVFEHHPIPSASDEVIGVLEAHGYDVYRIWKGLRSVSYAPLMASAGGAPTSDYVAVRPGTEAERRLRSR